MLTVKIEKEELGDDPPIETFHVTIENATGAWTERYSRSELGPFLRGFQAGAGMSGGGHIELPEIPQ